MGFWCAVNVCSTHQYCAARQPLTIGDGTIGNEDDARRYLRLYRACRAADLQQATARTEQRIDIQLCGVVGREVQRATYSHCFKSRRQHAVDCHRESLRNVYDSARWCASPGLRAGPRAGLHGGVRHPIQIDKVWCQLAVMTVHCMAIGAGVHSDAKAGVSIDLEICTAVDVIALAVGFFVVFLLLVELIVIRVFFAVLVDCVVVAGMRAAFASSNLQLLPELNVLRSLS